MPDADAPIKRFTAVKAGEKTKRFALSVGESDYETARVLAQKHGTSVGAVFRKAFHIVIAKRPDTLR